MLPGALLRNAGLKYICRSIHVRVENNQTPFTSILSKGEVLEIPIGHMEGNYFCDADTLKNLQDQDRIVFRYATKDGQVTAAANPNGSLDNIAGICSEGGNVLGMMPHPERSSETEMGCTDGFKLFEALVGAMANR
jgi:phosphoribosylformylglycinamidine synthase